MKTLTLIRHGKADWKAGKTDIERPLNHRGKSDAKHLGPILATHGIGEALFFISNAQRTQETFNILNKALNVDQERQIICPELYLCSSETLLDTAHFAPDSSEKVVLVAHNPSLAELASHFSHQPYIDMPTLAVYQCIFDTDKWENISLNNMIENRFLSPKTI